MLRAMHIKDDGLVPELSESLGENLLAAAYARVNTALGAARVLTPIGNYLIARPAARSAARKITEKTNVPLDAAMVIGLTGGALHVWHADPMVNQVGDHLGEVPLAKIVGITVIPGRSWQHVAITMADGQCIELEGRGAAHALAAEFTRQRPAE
jgi:hypothetical protein